MPYPKRKMGGALYGDQSAKRTRYTGGGKSLSRRMHAAAVKYRIANLRTGGYLGAKEVKFYDTALASSALGAPTGAAGGEHVPSATIMLNTVKQGTGESDRIGRQIRMNSIHITGVVTIAAQINQTAHDANQQVIIALVLDTQTNGVLLSSENVFLNPGASSLLACNLFRNLEFRQRFKVLAQKTITMPQQESTYDGTNIELMGVTKGFDLKANLNGLPVNYCGTTSDIANIVDNNLVIVAFTNHVSNVPLLSYNSRVLFTG